LVEVLERLTRTEQARYVAADDDVEAVRQWQTIIDHFAERGIECELVVAGWFAMAVPLNVTEVEFDELCAKCPIPLDV